MLYQHYFVCDLKNNPQLIAEYKKYHQNVWPEILQDIKNQGIEKMEIFSVLNRMVMIVTTTEKNFNWDLGAKLAKRDDQMVEILNKWEDLMDTFQERIEGSEGIKWVKMDRIFSYE